MKQSPRPRDEGVITRRMWAGIFLVGVVMAAGTLLVFDTSLPGGLIEGEGTIRYGQTMAFTTLMMFQLFNALNARSDDESAFAGLFQNHWLWAAIGLSLLLHVAVVYVPFLQEAFSTVSLRAADWALCAGVASSVLLAARTEQSPHACERRPTRQFRQGAKHTTGRGRWRAQVRQ